MSQRGIQRTVIFICAFMALVLGLFVNKILQPRVLGPKELVANNAIIFSTPREISPLNLIDKKQQPFTGDDLKDKWTLVFFGFTNCPDICPITLTTFRKLAEKLNESPYGDSTEFLLVTLDPERDTPEILNTYIDIFNPEFNAVTGEFRDLLRFANELNVGYQKVMLDETNYTVDHGGSIALINPDGLFQGYFRPSITLAQLSLTYQSVRLSKK